MRGRLARSTGWPAGSGQRPTASRSAFRSTAWTDAAVDQVAIDLQGLGLDLCGVAFDPLAEVRGNGDRVTVDVLALPGAHAGLVPGGLGGFPQRLVTAQTYLLDQDVSDLTRGTS